MPTVISGTTGVSQVQAGAVESGDLPAGSVIQVVQATSTTSTATTSNSLVDVQPSVTITPLSTNNKILVMHTAGGQVKNDPQDIRFKLKRDGAIIWQSNAYGFIEAGNTNEWYAIPFHASYLDSPSTTSAIVYNFAIQTFSSVDIRHNEASAFVGNSTAITIAMEIAG